MATYAQPGAKRQKVRERIDNVDYFQGVDKVEYKAAAGPADTGSYRHYDAAARVQARAAEDWLKLSLSLTDFRHGSGSEHPGRPSPNRPWDDNTHSVDNYKRTLKAFFDLMGRLGVRYWTAFDSDLVPMGDSWEETRGYWEEMTEFIQELSQRSHVKLMWIAPDLHSHVRYSSGAFTSPDVTTFAQAATQIKKCLEVSQRLGAECFLLWPRREAASLFQADVSRELKLFAKLLKMTAEYKDRLNYRCQLLLMPHSPRSRGGEPPCTSGAAACLHFLRAHALERLYRVCAPPGHQLYMAHIYNMLGGVMITNDFDPSDSRTLTLMMKCIIDQGAPPPGGTSLRLRARRGGGPRSTAALHVQYVDSCARALRAAAALLQDQAVTKQMQQRYASYYSGFGSRLVSGDVSLEECEDYYKKNQPSNEPVASKTEHFDVMFLRYLDACEHI